jgi:hypothetical protein
MAVHESIDVSIVLPCLDEARTLPACIANAREALGTLRAELGLAGEIVVADNGSEDDSRQIAARLGARVVLIHHRGYGSALLAGCQAAEGRFIVIGDADGSYDFREAVAMVHRLGDGYELCMGSRLRGHVMPGAMPWKNRYIGNPVLSAMLNLLFRSGVSDAHCGLRAFTAAALQRLRLTSTGMEFASEMVVKAALLDLRRTEVPVTLHPDGRDRPPHLRPWRDGWRHLRYLLMLSPNWLFFFPALALGVVGTALSALLLSHRDGEMAAVGPLVFGDHWMIVGSAMLNASMQLAVFGLATTLYGIREGYRTATPMVVRLFAWFRLERVLIVGAILILLGLCFMFRVLQAWTSAGFGALDQIRQMIGGTTFVLMGLQMFFGGFFLSILNGNEAAIALEPKSAAMRTDAAAASTATARPR